MQVSNFLNNFDGGARSNLFSVRLEGMMAASANPATKFEYHCKASSFPGGTVGVIPVNYRGRVVSIPGDRTYDDWTFTVYNDEKMQLKKSFIEFQELYNDHINNTPNQGSGEDVLQLIRGSNATVSQLDRQGNATLSATLGMCWIDNIASHDVSWDTQDAISEFTVTLKFHVLTYIQSPGLTGTSPTGASTSPTGASTNPGNAVEGTGIFAPLPGGETKS